MDIFLPAFFPSPAERLRSALSPRFFNLSVRHFNEKNAYTGVSFLLNPKRTEAPRNELWEFIFRVLLWNDLDVNIFLSRSKTNPLHVPSETSHSVCTAARRGRRLFNWLTEELSVTDCGPFHREFNSISSHFWVAGARLDLGFAPYFAGVCVLPTHSIQRDLPYSSWALACVNVPSELAVSAPGRACVRARSLATERCICAHWAAVCVFQSLLSPEGYRAHSSIPSWLLWKQQGCKNCVLRGADGVLAVITTHFNKVFHRLFASQNTRKPFHFFHESSD